MDTFEPQLKFADFAVPEEEKIFIGKFRGCAYPHTHDFLELVYIYTGKAQQEVDGRQYSISTGDCFLIDIGSVHKIYSESEDFCLINCLFLPDFLSEATAGDKTFIELASNVFSSSFCATTDGGLFAKSQRGCSFREFFTRIEEEYSEKRRGYIEVIRSLVKVILIYIFRRQSECALPPLVDDVINYINASSGKTSVSGIGREMFFSPTYISRLFRKYTGMGLSEYIRDKRLECVCEKLLKTDDSIDSIMLAAGFGDKKNFYDQFGRKYGCTPGEYRGKKS